MAFRPYLPPQVGLPRPGAPALPGMAPPMPTPLPQPAMGAQPLNPMMQQRRNQIAAALGGTGMPFMARGNNLNIR